MSPLTESILLASLGGVLIGLAALALMAFNGRIAGISGVLGTALTQARPEWWRWAFVGGLVAGGLVLLAVYPAAFTDLSDVDLVFVGAAGLLVGFGTRLGSGCTSGHGVCGVSRLGPRSIIATLVFMATGVLTVLIAH